MCRKVCFYSGNLDPTISMDWCVHEFAVFCPKSQHFSPHSVAPHPSFHSLICPSILMLGRFPNNFYWMNASRMAKLYGPFSWRQRCGWWWRQNRPFSTIYAHTCGQYFVFCYAKYSWYIWKATMQTKWTKTLHLEFIFEKLYIWAEGVCCVDACLAA